MRHSFYFSHQRENRPQETHSIVIGYKGVECVCQRHDYFPHQKKKEFCSLLLRKLNECVCVYNFSSLHRSFVQTIQFKVFCWISTVQCGANLVEKKQSFDAFVKGWLLFYVSFGAPHSGSLSALIVISQIKQTNGNETWNTQRIIQEALIFFRCANLILDYIMAGYFTPFIFLKHTNKKLMNSVHLRSHIIVRRYSCCFYRFYCHIIHSMIVFIEHPVKACVVIHMHSHRFPALESVSSKLLSDCWFKQTIQKRCVWMNCFWQFSFSMHFKRKANEWFICY